MFIGKGFVAILLVIFLWWCVQDASSEGTSTSRASDSGLDLSIKKRLTEGKTPSRTVVGGEQIYSTVLVESFYKRRNYQPAWSENGRLQQVDTLLKAIGEAYGDGLTPDYYHYGPIRSLVASIEKASSPDPPRLADLDILLTDAFLTLGCHLSGGCVNPVTLETEWFAKRRDVDVASVLEQALKKRQLKEALERFRPEEGSYLGLRQALAHYRELSSKGEWSLVPGGPLLKKTSRSERVAALRRRLASSGDLERNDRGGDFFDETLRKSVISFQKRHGLKADGIVGVETLDALNVPLKQRIRQMELNMERLRWILSNREQRSVVVNIANFRLDVIENGQSILSMKAVVGKPYWDTPVFTAKMTHVIINPCWNVPESIARKEILKKARKNPHYLSEQNIKVLKGWGPREEERDPETIDWSKITPSKLSYRFRQEPGPLNPLGRLKFMFPNAFDVYLHDTPAKGLFLENVRTFSHGCIRIERPIELAEYLLRDDPWWTKVRLLAAIENGAEQKVSIPHPLNVHFHYLTAWVDEAGTLQFRNDIYGRDVRLDEALRKKASLP
ncbi:MAG TPA: L,D-transpeptidase family protein [Thermodesulfovibrionales bacterium]|nr:L,D-transpeptidase family protein [Thermodesulfovibrionales bacterium]